MTERYDSAIGKIRRVLESDRNVLGLVLVGSRTYTDTEPDEWSDIDLALVVKDDAREEFYPATAWLSRLGDVYAFALSDWDFGGHIRTYFADGLRVDFGVIPESALAHIDEWQVNSFAYRKQCLFSRSEVLDGVLARKFPRGAYVPVPAEQIERTVNDFRFKAMLAVSKVGRNELLVALHLSLDLVRDCLLLAMILRDREAGSDHHRDGSQGNHLAAELAPCAQPFTTEGILDSIEHSTIAFDSLAARLIEEYRENRGPLLEFIARARRSDGYTTGE